MDGRAGRAAGGWSGLSPAYSAVDSFKDWSQQVGDEEAARPDDGRSPRRIRPATLEMDGRWFGEMREKAYARRLRIRPARPSRPVPSNAKVDGSGTVGVTSVIDRELIGKEKEALKVPKLVRGTANSAKEGPPGASNSTQLAPVCLKSDGHAVPVGSISTESIEVKIFV